jgi:ribosomal protein L37AE/L43A
MSGKHTPEIKKVCPVCRQPMILLHEIRRAFAEDLYVFKCQPCGFSMTEPASWTTRPQNASAARRLRRAKRATTLRAGLRGARTLNRAATNNAAQD